MTPLLDAVRRLSRFLNGIAGVALVFLMLLTVADVVLRMFKKPIVGTYEMVLLSGAIVIGFALPLTSWTRSHIFVDFFLSGLPRRLRTGFNVVTRLLGIGIFGLAGWNLFRYGWDLRESGEVSLTLQLPFYPIAIGVGASCLILCLVLACDIVRIARGGYE
jgi:TRAP-type C4-dicarboxylate transport system permease small subunit